MLRSVRALVNRGHRDFSGCIIALIAIILSA
ncbi:hypothetical protein UFOVP421_20 [uncultured Caudovirales phage]|uniref:Uncharacterized protein n=1 Tax=uncultured Caudovirales phage TaxID=2100421 RepID=A0A6J5M986_9CAUD|nr:hypothetical protein UFOVP421_20 [uncultured Caudovirales phage]